MTMLETPLITVIVPLHNAEHTIGRCLCAIQEQQYKNFEVILVDDGSSDGSVQVCRHFVEHDKRFHLFRQKNSGVASARNSGLQKMTGTYLVFVDSDDYIQKNYLSTLLETITFYGADMVVCDFWQRCSKTNEEDMFHYTAAPGSYYKKDYLSQLSKCPGAHYFGVLWNKIYKVAIIQKERLHFDPKLTLGEDFVFNMQYLAHIDKIKILPEKLYIYSWNSQNSLTHMPKSVEKQIHERVLLYNAYRQLFYQAGLERRWFYKLHFYMLKAYFEELKELGQNAGPYQKIFYKEYIEKNGIGKLEFSIVCFLKWVKRLIKL